MFRHWQHVGTVGIPTTVAVVAGVVVSAAVGDVAGVTVIGTLVRVGVTDGRITTVTWAGTLDETSTSTLITTGFPTLGVRVGVVVTVGVAVFVGVEVAVLVAVAVFVGVAVGVFVGVAVGVLVGVVVNVAVLVAVGVSAQTTGAVLLGSEQFVPMHERRSSIAPGVAPGTPLSHTSYDSGSMSFGPGVAPGVIAVVGSGVTIDRSHVTTGVPLMSSCQDWTGGFACVSRQRTCNTVAAPSAIPTTANAASITATAPRFHMVPSGSLAA